MKIMGASKTRLDRQKEDYDAALKETQRNNHSAVSAGKLLYNRKSYLDELSNTLDNAGQTETEKMIFNPTTNRPVDKNKNWWE
jgi:hypothetical protein